MFIIVLVTLFLDLNCYLITPNDFKDDASYAKMTNLNRSCVSFKLNKKKDLNYRFFV